MPEELSKLAADSSGNPLVQSPILLVPKKYPSAANNPICFRCGPPAAPERPYVSYLYIMLHFLFHCHERNMTNYYYRD